MEGDGTHRRHLTSRDERNGETTFEKHRGVYLVPSNEPNCRSGRDPRYRNNTQRKVAWVTKQVGLDEYRRVVSHGEGGGRRDQDKSSGEGRGKVGPLTGNGLCWWTSGSVREFVDDYHRKRQERVS